MSRLNLKRLRLSDKDLDFLIDTASPGVSDKQRLKQIINEDEDFRTSFIADERVFRKLMGDGEVFLKISPSLFLRFCSGEQRGIWKEQAIQ